MKMYVPTKRNIIFIKVKSCNASLLTLLVCLKIYIKSALRYKFLILNTSHPDTIFKWPSMWGFLVIFEAKRDPRAKTFEKHWLKKFIEKFLQIT